MPPLGSVHPTTEQLVGELVSAIEARSTRPLLVGVDGRSGSGKSTLVAAVAASLGSTAVIKGDEFYTGGAQEEWDHHSARDKASLVIDWRRQLEVLNTLRTGQPAQWYCYDWEAFDGRLADDPTITPAADVVILEGAYSCRPELAEHLDLTVMLRIDHEVRRERLRLRDGLEYRDDWLGRWTEAEDYYFSKLRPPGTFDLVLDA